MGRLATEHSRSVASGAVGNLGRSGRFATGKLGAVTPTFADLAKAKYILLTTFTKDGRPKPTPIWAAADGDRLLAISAGKAWKVKRIRNNPRITLATCNVRGCAPSAGVQGNATILDKLQTGSVYDAICKQYGIQGRLFNFVSKLRGGMQNNVGLELRVSGS